MEYAEPFTIDIYLLLNNISQCHLTDILPSFVLLYKCCEIYDFKLMICCVSNFEYMLTKKMSCITRYVLLGQDILTGIYQ